MNIDFSARPGFSFYVIFLMLSGIVLVALGAPAIRQTTRWQRILNVAIGFAMLGYGIYLGFIFSGGHYVFFFYAFIVPIVLIWRTFSSAVDERAARPPGLEPSAAEIYAERGNADRYADPLFPEPVSPGPKPTDEPS